MKVTRLFLILAVVLGISAPSWAKDINIGVTIYKFDDTFMTAVRNMIADTAKKNGVKADIVDAQNSQANCNDKVDLFITKKYDALAINMVDRTAASVIYDKALKAKKPVVFFNKEPIAEEMVKWANAFYVGAKAEQSGTMEGQLVVDYFKAHPTKDGVIKYVMLKGEPGHQDAELRTKYSIETITKAGFKVQKIAEDTAMWDRVKGQEKMAAFIAANPNKIDVVLANNDDMALGAIAALKANGYFKGGKYMPVVGVDATSAGIAALKDGTLLGTVLNDAKNQGKATLMLAKVLASGQKPTKANVGYPLTDHDGKVVADGKYIWVPYAKITKSNIKDAL